MDNNGQQPVVPGGAPAGMPPAAQPEPVQPVQPVEPVVPTPPPAAPVGGQSNGVGEQVPQAPVIGGQQ